jgi:DNA polymerase V
MPSRCFAPILYVFTVGAPMRIYPHLPPSRLALPLFSHAVRAGFPSPAESYIEKRLDLNEHLIAHPAATYFVRAEGDSMQDYGIETGSLLIVDRALKPIQGDIVIAVVEGELTCKRLDLKGKMLLSGNADFPPIAVEDLDVSCEGVVVASIRYYRHVLPR